MASLSGSFTGTGQTSTVLLLRTRTAAAYTLGAFASGSVYLERTLDGGISWQVVATHTGVVTDGYYENESLAEDMRLRLRSASATTIAWTLLDVSGEPLFETVVNDRHGNRRYYVDDAGFFRAEGYKNFAGTEVVVGGIEELNGETETTQSFAVGTSGTDYAVSSSGGIHTFNLPNAGASARGVVSTGAQSFAGAKTFLSAPILDSLTATTVPYLNGSKALASSAVTPTELGYLSGVTSAIQTQLGLKAPLASPTFTTSTRHSYGTASTVPYFDASKDLVSSAVTPTELGYLSGVTSAVQTQLGTKAPLASPTFTTSARFSFATASTVPYFDASKDLVSSAVTPTELGYVSGVTSAIQTQINAKAPSTSPAFATSARFSYATATTVPYLDSNKDLVSSAVTPTELGYLSSVTSAIQTQLNAKAPAASPAFTTQVTFGNYHMEPSEQDAGNSSTADTIDLSLGSAIKSTLTGNVTYTLTNPVTGGTYVFRILTGAGSFTVTWPATVKWSTDQGTYVATTTASRMDLVSLYWDGTNYYGSYVKGFTP